MMNPSHFSRPASDRFSVTVVRIVGAAAAGVAVQLLESVLLLGICLWLPISIVGNRLRRSVPQHSRSETWTPRARLAFEQARESQASPDAGAA